MEGGIVPLRINAQALPRALHVCALNDTDRPLNLYFKNGHMWRLMLLDEQGTVHTYHIDSPTRATYWSQFLEPGQTYETTFTNLPAGTFQARVDLMVEWADPIVLDSVTL